MLSYEGFLSRPSIEINAIYEPLIKRNGSKTSATAVRKEKLQLMLSYVTTTAAAISTIGRLSLRLQILDPGLFHGTIAVNLVKY